MIVPYLLLVKVWEDTLILCNGRILSQNSSFFALLVQGKFFAHKITSSFLAIAFRNAIIPETLFDIVLNVSMKIAL